MNKDRTSQYMSAPEGMYEKRSKNGVRWKATKEAGVINEEEASEIVIGFEQERNQAVEDREPEVQSEESEEIPHLHNNTMVRHYSTPSHHTVVIVQHPWMSEPLMCMEDQLIIE